MLDGSIALNAAAAASAAAVAPAVMSLRRHSAAALFGVAATAFYARVVRP